MERSTHQKLSTLAALVACALAASALARPVVAQTGQTETRRIVVLVRGLRNDHGEMVAGLYTSPRVWLGANRAAANCHAGITSGEARCVFDITAAGPVAFAGMHDEDADGELDRDLLGLPQEGYAFSNDAREPFGPPSFEAAAFSPPELRPFVVHARYGI
jgi:uncharacterized protein (DUF2141 family)